MNGFNNLLYISKERTGGLKQVRLRKKKNNRKHRTLNDRQNMGYSEKF